MNKKLYPIIMIMFLSSCNSYNQNSYQHQQSDSHSIIYKKTDHSFFFGLQEQKPIEECNDHKILKTESKNGFLNYLIRIYTLGIYWPRTIEIECKT
jgi:hypothetical protein